jgi:hypothetical protein
MRTKITAAIAALALVTTALATATPASAQWRHHGGGYHHHHGGWGRGGAAIGGFAAGALIGGALASRSYAYDDGYYAEGPAYYSGGDATGYCMQRFRSYDPASGTYLGYDGMRHPCP